MFTQQEHVILLTINLSLLKTFHWLHSSALRIHFKFRPWYFFDWLKIPSRLLQTISVLLLSKTGNFPDFLPPQSFSQIYCRISSTINSLETPDCLSLGFVRHVGKCPLFIKKKYSLLPGVKTVFRPWLQDKTQPNRKQFCTFKHETWGTKISLFV